MGNFISSDTHVPSSFGDELLSILFAHPWQIIFGTLLLCWTGMSKLVMLFRTLFRNNMLLRYDYMLMKVDLIQRNMEVIQNHEVLVLKKKNEEIAADIASIRASLRELHKKITCRDFSIQNITTGCPPPPPPPPLPPTMYFQTPVLKILPTSAKTDVPKKKDPDGPPQLCFSQVEITSMIRKLRKTSSRTKTGVSRPISKSPHSRLRSVQSAARTVECGSVQKQPNEKTPPRRNLFGRTMSLGQRRSLNCSGNNDEQRPVEKNASRSKHEHSSNENGMKD